MNAGSSGRYASLSLDLDNLWTYMKIHGDEGWKEMPSYLDYFVPLVLGELERRGCRITFFIVGEDAAREESQPVLRQISDAGHDIGNHSFRHEPWLHLYARDELVEELGRAEDAIEEATGIRPRGFRGPGFSVSETVLDVLCERGYDYDASTLPMYIGPLARRYYFWTAKLTAEERRKRSILFGQFRDGFRPAGAYRWKLDDRSLLEIPVTTIPGFKVPFHLSYLLFLSIRSHALAKAYFRFGLSLCRMNGVAPSILLHPLDFLGGDEVPKLAFFPAMQVPGEEKRRWASDFLDILEEGFEVVTMADHAARVPDRLASREPDFAAS